MELMISAMLHKTDDTPWTGAAKQSNKMTRGRARS
jgi:hypothetical protein